MGGLRDGSRTTVDECRRGAAENQEKPDVDDEAEPEDVSNRRKDGWEKFELLYLSRLISLLHFLWKISAQSGRSESALLRNTLCTG